MNKPMLAVLAAVALSTLTAAAVPTFAAKPAAAKPAKTAAAQKPGRGGGMQKMADALGLTAAQKAQMKSLQDKQKQQATAIKADASLSYDAKTAKLKALKKSNGDQMKAILTPAQQAKMKELRQQQRQERKSNA